MIVDIRDQLGNQLFTYAATKCICIDTNQRFQWFSSDTGIVNSYDKRLGNKIDGGAFPNIDMSERVSPIAKPLYDWAEVLPPGTTFMEETYLLKETDLIRGHFQSPRYFSHHRDDVLSWYELRQDVQDIAISKLTEIKQDNPNRVLVSVHLRRGWDYLREGRLLNEGYYIGAISALCEKIGVSRKDLLLVLFSDVVLPRRFVRKLKADFVMANGSLFEDLALMTLCDHHIVSNSTFSWWGAWLDKQNGLVLRPSVFPTSTKTNCPNTIFPDEWISVEARGVHQPITVFLKKCIKKIQRYKNKKSNKK